MTLRVRDRANKEARLEADQQAREVRKQELKNATKPWADLHLDSYDKEITRELLEENATLVEESVKSPAQAQEQINAEYLKRAREVADVWCESEPAYYMSSANSEAMTNWLIEHPEHRADNLESFNQAFTELRKQGKLEQRPQPSREDKARDYFEKVVHHAEGRDWTEHDLDRLSADRYKVVMNIPQRAPLGSLLRPHTTPYQGAWDVDLLRK